MPPETPPPGDDPPKALTVEEIGQIVNAAIVNHEKRNAPKRDEALKALIGEAIKGIAPAPPPPPPPLKEGDPKQSPEMAAFLAKQEALEKKLTAALEESKNEKAAREAAEKKARDDRTFNDFRTALSPHVRPDMLDDLAQLHFHAHKRVTFDEEGKPLYRVRRAPGPGMPEADVDMPLADGVGFWLKSKDAQRYLPAPGSGGGAGTGGGAGGQRQGRPPPPPQYAGPATTDDERARRAYENEQRLRAAGHEP